MASISVTCFSGPFKISNALVPSHLVTPTVNCVCAADEGGFFPKWKRDTGYYIQQMSDDVKRWLKKLRQQGNKKLFVLTSSYADFAAASLEHILG
jgi:hypothetical protein